MLSNCNSRSYKFIEEVLPVCNQKRWSEKLTDKSLQAYEPEEKWANLGMVILAFAALTDGIKIFAQLWYILEGEPAIILRSDEIFKRLEHVIDGNYKWPSLNRFADNALCLNLKRCDTFMNHKQISMTKLDTAKLIFLEANGRVQGINN